MSARPRLFVELCCGSGAVTLRLLGGPTAHPPCSYQGAKRGYAAAILGTMGLHSGLGADRVLLVDPGPWSRAWTALADPAQRAAVVAVIRSYIGEEPRALFARLWADRPLMHAHPAGPPEVAAWLLLQRWSFSGRGPARGYGGPGCIVAAPGANWTTEQRDKAIERAKFAADIEALPPFPPTTVALDARDVEAAGGEGVYAFIDPPYSNTTKYDHDLPRADVLALALRWHEAGAVVCVSEAEPLPLPGWEHVEITAERIGQARTFGATREWLTINRPPAVRAGVQRGLFG